ncbi:MAG: Na+/H+ antiporter subunit E [Candidatus Omnitrophota bacterium]
MRSRSRIVTFFVSYALWLLLSFSLDWQHIITGAFVALIVALVMGDMFTERPRNWLNPSRYGWFAVYVFVFAWECIKANLDVACRVVSPKLPINPGIVKVKTILKSEASLAFLANFITLTPGTLSVDVDQAGGYLYIHWIDVKSRDIEGASRIIVSKFEKILKEVFE